MRIGEAAQQSGTSVRALRHFEDEGLIAPGRDPNGYRDFCPSTVASARTVRALIDHGLPARLVREVLPHLDHGATLPSEPCDRFIAALIEQRDLIAHRIAVLTDNRDALDGYLAAATAGRRASGA